MDDDWLEIVNEMSDDCVFLSAKGVVVKALHDCLDLPAEDLLTIGDHVAVCLHQYATDLCGPNQIPAIVYTMGYRGEFQPIDTGIDDEEEVM